MGDYQPYIKFMSDIIDSGLWAKLSVGARTLYPVLLKFSDQNFKQVWPSTGTLMQLTGFKTKKSVIEAKKDLVKAGLIQVINGNGHTNSVYYFTFNYEGSKIAPQWDKKIHPCGSFSHPSGESLPTHQGGQKLNPNQINITITNKQTNKKEFFKEEESQSYEKLIQDYGNEIFSYAFKEAKKRGMEKQYAYIKAICKDRTEYLSEININQLGDENKATWFSFLEWARKKLTQDSVKILESLEPQVDGKTIFIETPISQFLQQVITKYFKEEGSGLILVIFSENKKEVRF